jgi:hypothetical protein
MIYLAGMDALRTRETDDLRETMTIAVNHGMAGKEPQRSDTGAGSAPDRIEGGDVDRGDRAHALREAGFTVL